MKKTALILFTYAFIILIGGIAGYTGKGSHASLISGLLFGLLLIGNSLWMLKTKKLSSIYTALFLTFFLDGFFTLRWIKTKHFIPSGIICLISLMVIFLLVSAARQHLKKKSA